MWGNDNVRGIALAFFLAVAIKTKSVRTDFFVVAKVRSFLGIAKKIVVFVIAALFSKKSPCRHQRRQKAYCCYDDGCCDYVKTSDFHGVGVDDVRAFGESEQLEVQLQPADQKSDCNT